MLNDTERIEMLLSYLKQTKNSLGVSLGDKNGMRLQHVISGRNAISEKLARDIVETYPNISFDWLLKGEGEMVSNGDIVVKESLTTNKKENDIIETKSKLFKLIPFYNINVSAGNVDFLDSGILVGQEPDDYLQIPANVDADISFPTFGHSMYPEISNGDRVAYKVITDWTFFNYGMKYLIITKEQRMVKYIKKHPKEGFLLLESRNKDYEPIDMPISSITNILQVRYICKTEM